MIDSILIRESVHGPSPGAIRNQEFRIVLGTIRIENRNKIAIHVRGRRGGKANHGLGHTTPRCYGWAVGRGRSISGASAKHPLGAARSGFACRPAGAVPRISTPWCQPRTRDVARQPVSPACLAWSRGASESWRLAGVTIEQQLKALKNRNLGEYGRLPASPNPNQINLVQCHNATINAQHRGNWEINQSPDHRGIRDVMSVLTSEGRVT